MFRRFRAKIRVYGNRRHGCSFKATINFLIWNNVELVGLQNCNLGFWKFRKLKTIKIFDNCFLFQNFNPQNHNFQKTGQHVRGKWLINMCTKFQVNIFKKWLRYDIKHVNNRHFHVISGLYHNFPNFIFWPILMLQKVFYGHFSRFLRKSDLKTCIAALSYEIFCLTFFTWWPDMTLTSIMVIKHSKWYLQMSETLSMPISWLCLCLTSQFCSPMSPSPKCRTFWLWPDLWRHS